MSEVRVRFAPSPTGYVHIGGLRTALYNYLYARNQNGKLILRIEDTDRTRFVEGALENLIKVLQWSGIDYDEGVFLEGDKLVERGEYGPYIQSERVRQGIYKPYVEQLLEEGKAYYCFCSKERLDHLRDVQRADGLIPRYDGLCRSVTLEEARQRVANGEEHVIRLKLPTHRDIVIKDLVKGTVTINTKDMDDQVLVKSDGYPTYHLAVVVDDHLMKITHVIRGDEWIPSTPKHLYLYEAFGWEAPAYVHLPTVLNKNRKKLSKRNDDVAVEDFREQGYLPEALINYLALVGWSPESNQEILSKEELIQQFGFDRVSTTGGIFDRDKLNWVNAHDIREMDTSRLVEELRPYLQKAGLINEETDEDFLTFLVGTFKENLETLSDIVLKAKDVFEDEATYDPEVLDMLQGEGVPALLDAFSRELDMHESVDEAFAKNVMKTVQKETGIKGKNLWMPMRGAITGNVHGPELVNIMILLGKQRLQKRIEKAKEIAGR